MYEREDGPQEGFRIPSETNADSDTHPERLDAGKKETLLWQLHGKYILTQIRSGVMILDQNAAHERILYEKALHSLESGFGLSQQLLFPHTLEFNPAEHELIKELLPDLRALGFEIETFGGRSVIVRGVPAELRVGDERKILEEILEQFNSNREALKLKGRENLAKSMARRGAIRSGTALDIKEMRSLIDQLFLCEMPYFCPYGRPTIVNISIEELDKRFGKSG
jgi:DNA mismatch repair protein MutL